MNLEAKLEEYRQIRADIRQLYERRDRTFYLAFFVFIGVISVGIQFKNSILFFMTSIILLFLWSREILRQIAIHRYDTYVLVNIEKYIQGLERTSISEFHPYCEDIKKVIPYLALPFLVLICLVLGIYYFFDSCNPIITYRGFLFFEISIPIFFIILVIWSRWVIKESRKKEKENWEEAQKEWEKIQKELKDKNKSIPQ
jgi:amino acid permease